MHAHAPFSNAPLSRGPKRSQGRRNEPQRRRMRSDSCHRAPAPAGVSTASAVAGAGKLPSCRQWRSGGAPKDVALLALPLLAARAAANLLSKGILQLFASRSAHSSPGAAATRPAGSVVSKPIGEHEPALGAVARARISLCSHCSCVWRRAAAPPGLAHTRAAPRPGPLLFRQA